MTERSDRQKKKTVSTTKMFAEAMRELLPYTNLPYQLAVTILVFFGIGYGLDKWLDSGTTYTVILSIAGVALGLFSFVKTAMYLSTRKSTKTPKDDSH